MVFAPVWHTQNVLIAGEDRQDTPLVTFEAHRAAVTSMLEAAHPPASSEWPSERDTACSTHMQEASASPPDLCDRLHRMTHDLSLMSGSGGSDHGLELPAGSAAQAAAVKVMQQQVQMCASPPCLKAALVHGRPAISARWHVGCTHRRVRVACEHLSFMAFA